MAPRKRHGPPDPLPHYLKEEYMPWVFPDDLTEAAWGLIANAWDGNWNDAPVAWREAAIRWREAYHKTLPGHEHKEDQ